MILWHEFGLSVHVAVSSTALSCAGNVSQVVLARRGYVHQERVRPAVISRKKRLRCICSAPAGLMVTVLGDAKKGVKLQDRYKLGQVYSLTQARISHTNYCQMRSDDTQILVGSLKVRGSVGHSQIGHYNPNGCLTNGMQVLGKGAFGIVYEAISLEDKRQYACKSISKAKLVTKVNDPY